MLPTDRTDFVKIVIGFAELKGKSLSAPALELYWNAMQSWSLEDFRAAANHLIGTTEFMPTPKDFNDLRNAARPTAAEAFLEARRYLKWGIHAYTLDPACPSLIARCVYAIGGPNAIALCETDKLHFLERQFSAIYDGMESVQDIRQALPAISAGGLKRVGATPLLSTNRVR